MRRLCEKSGGRGLETKNADHLQNSVAFLRFSVPRHHFCFNADGRANEAEPPLDTRTSSVDPDDAEGEDDDPLDNLFEGRFIVLPDVLCTVQHAFSTLEPGAKRRQRAGSSSSDDDDDESGDSNRRGASAVARTEEHLSARAVLGPLKATLRVKLFTKALAFLAKLERQISTVTANWVAAEERRKEKPPPSIEASLNRAASRVRLWYQLSVVFSGIRIKMVSPDAVALLRLTDLTLQVSNEAMSSAETESGSLQGQEAGFSLFLFLTLCASLAVIS